MAHPSLRLGSFSRLVSFGLVSFGLAATAGCNVYTTDLLEGGAGEGAGNSGGQGAGAEGAGAAGAGGEGGSVACNGPSDCPGVDSECGTRTCEGGVCGVIKAEVGTEIEDQTDGDCQLNICDGAGSVTTESDDADIDDDGNDCTVDACENGAAVHTPADVGESCETDRFCNAESECVECVLPGDCASGVCAQDFTCSPASCGDAVQNGDETDVNCGGSMCPACEIGETCETNADCLSSSCDGTCQPSCQDGILNQDESDLDCGGICGDTCEIGDDCNEALDCASNACTPAGLCTCAPRNGIVLISEVRSRGPAAGNDDFIELFNPGTAPVTLTADFEVSVRSNAAGSYSVRFTGGGQVVPAGGHFLIVGSAFSGGSGDAVLSAGVTDAASVIVENAGTVLDAVCFSCSAAEDFTGYTCEGAYVQKTGCADNVDKSIERRPGAPVGNCVDAGDNSADFAEIAPSTPQNLASPPTP